MGVPDSAGSETHVAQISEYEFCVSLLCQQGRQGVKAGWSNIATVEDYFRTNMDFLKPEIRDYFFKQYPDVYSKVGDLPPAKYNVGARIKNSLISSGSKQVYGTVCIGYTCHIRGLHQ